ncbi:hypothetical protein [Tellurirhabdus bombi]|uniref:hypothetical protein n=1 Tax=Tellurirhabdus bombi TaxID=2907205 RepID=UPI001F38E18A|nr:hypothetical protein [Tellurirhabdus bombi]
MASTQTQISLINSTVETFNGNVTSVSAQDGISLIDNWVAALHSGDESTNPIANTLSELKMQLQAGNPNSEQIDVLLQELADQTEQIAPSADESVTPHLRELAQSLRGFSDLIAGRSKPDFEGSKGQIFTGTHTGSATGNAGAPEMGRKDGSPGDTNEAAPGSGTTDNNSQTGTPNPGTDMRVPGNSTREGGSES